MRDGVPHFRGFDRVAKSLRFGFRNRFGAPLRIAFGKDLHTITTGVDGSLNGKLVPTGNRHVSA